MSWPRRLGLVALSAAGFAVGFYSGFFFLLSVVGLDDFQGWQFLVATLPAAGVLAGLAAMVVGGRSAALPLTGVVTASVVALVVESVGADFGVAFGLGGAIVVVAVAVVAESVNRKARG